jgi:hypothetical protein
MFLRFSKGPKSWNNVKCSTYYDKPKQYFLKAVFLGDSLVMEYGDDIIGIAKLHEETDKYLDFDVVVASNNPNVEPDKIARSIKDMIGKSNKFSLNPSNKKRKYYVEEVDCEVLPIKAEIKFSKNTKYV